MLVRCPQDVKGYDFVTSSIVALLGVVGNVVATIVLMRPSMRNSFNLLLVTLAFVDLTFLVLNVAESLRVQFAVHVRLHFLLVPHFFYPMKFVALTASIFLTVAIALERFMAVHYPLDYNVVSG